MTPPRYTQLRTPGLGWLSFSRVYLARDHLLVVDCSGMEERYRHFLLTDIQAILIRRTVYGQVLSLTLALLGSLFLAIGISIGAGGLMFWRILSGLTF